MRLKLACLNGTRRDFEISIGGFPNKQISQIFLEFVESLNFNEYLSFITINKQRDKARNKEGKTFGKTLFPTNNSRSFEKHSFIVSFVNFFSPSRSKEGERHFLGQGNCRQSSTDDGRPCEKQTRSQVFLPSGGPHERKCNQRNGR